MGVEKIYRVWFGEVYAENGKFKARRSDNLIESFKECLKNKEKIPFSLIKAGTEIFGSEEMYYKNLRKVAISTAYEKVEENLKRDDRYLIMLLKAVDEIDQSINLFEEKIRDIEEIKITKTTVEFREAVKNLKKLRKSIQDEINDLAAKIMPNVTEILGGVLSARLLEKAGSLKRLSSLPASTIQILGAEKSLFKAVSRIKKGKPAKTPKHGLIFQHPFIRTLPKSRRGKMARFMAAKLAIAARIDYYSGELNESLLEAIKRKYEELR